MSAALLIVVLWVAILRLTYLVASVAAPWIIGGRPRYWTRGGTKAALDWWVAHVRAGGTSADVACDAFCAEVGGSWLMFHVDYVTPLFVAQREYEAERFDAENPEAEWNPWRVA